MLGTLLLPISERDYIFPDWENTVRSLVLPKKNMKVVLSDATGGSQTGIKAEEVVRSLGFAKVEICRFKQQPVPSHFQHWEHYLKIGLKCAETYEAGLKAVEGPLIFGLEDDIVAPPNSFISLLETFISNPKTGLIAACTYNKKLNNNTHVIGQAIDFSKILVEPDSTGTQLCQSNATGCFITYANLMKNFHLKDSVMDEDASPDYTYSLYLRECHQLQVVLSHNVKTKHIFYSNETKNYAGLLQCNSVSPNIPVEIKDYSNATFKARTPKAPIFIIGYTPRTGSTLVQRLLSSVNRTVIWGEPQGAIAEIYNFHQKILEINKSYQVQSSRNQFNQLGYKGFIPNLSPTTQKHHTIKSHLRSLFEWHFDTASYDNWGFKVINWTPQMISRLHFLFPDASFIFLKRNYKDVAISIERRRKEWWPHVPMSAWKNNYDRISIYTKILPVNMHAINIDFDEYKNDISALCDLLETELKLGNEMIDRSICNDYVSDMNDANKLYL